MDCMSCKGNSTSKVFVNPNIHYKDKVNNSYKNRSKI